MKSVKEKERDFRDFKIEIIEGKKKYITEAMEFRQKILREKERTDDLNKKKELW